MRARKPDSEGLVDHDGVKIHYEVYGDGGPTILLMPTWTIVHKQTWKMQIPYLARHHRVVVYDGPGNGRSDHSLSPEAYHHTTQVEYALRVMDATGTDRAVLGALSMAAQWVLELAADHPDRVLGIVTIAGSVPLEDSDSDSGGGEDPFLGLPPDLPLSRVPELGQDPSTHWAKMNRRYWLGHHQGFTAVFFRQCFSRPHPTQGNEGALRLGRRTKPGGGPPPGRP